MSRHAWILILAQCCFFPCVCAAAPLSTQNIADRVGFDQHLSAVVPSDLRFRDETGRAVSIGDYRGTAPIVLVFLYLGVLDVVPDLYRQSCADARTDRSNGRSPVCGPRGQHRST